MGHPAGLRAGTRVCYNPKIQLRTAGIAPWKETDFIFTVCLQQGFPQEGYDQAVYLLAPIQVSGIEELWRVEIDWETESEISLTSRPTVPSRRVYVTSQQIPQPQNVISDHKTRRCHTRFTTERLVSSTTLRSPRSVSSSTRKSSTGTSRSVSTSESSTSPFPAQEKSLFAESRQTPS